MTSYISKVHTATAIISGLFIIGMFFVFFHPVHIEGTGEPGDIETLYAKNQGLIWLVGICLGTGIFVMTYINGIYQRELNSKNKIIEEQNRQVISNQLEYISQIKKLGEDLNENFEKDNRSREKMIEVVDKVTRFAARLEMTEKEVKRWSRVHAELESLTILVKYHDEDIKILKKT